MRLLCSRHLITTRIPASLEHCTKSLIAPSHCLCAKCFILLRRANNEEGKKKSKFLETFGKPGTTGRGQPRWRERAEPGMVTIGATSEGAGGIEGGGEHLSRPERVSLTLLRFRGDLQGRRRRRRRHTSSPTSGPACLSTCLGLTARRSLVLRSIACSSRRAPFGRLSPRSSTSSVTGSPPFGKVVPFVFRLSSEL